MGRILLPNNRCCFNVGLIYLWGSLFYTSMERSTIALVGQQPQHFWALFQLNVPLQNIQMIMKILEIKWWIWNWIWKLLWSTFSCKKKLHLCLYTVQPYHHKVTHEFPAQKAIDSSAIFLMRNWFHPIKSWLIRKVKF